MSEHAGNAGAGDLRRRRCHRDGGRYAVEDQERRREKPAADAEHAGHETDKIAHADERHNICAHFGNGKVNLHFDPVMRENVSMVMSSMGSRNGGFCKAA